MNTHEIRVLTDIIYRSLFDMDAAALRIQFGLPPCSPDDVTDDDIRDCMGIDALEAIMHIEDVLEPVFRLSSDSAFESYKIVTRTQAEDTARKYRQRAKEAGIDLLTGKKVEG